MPNILTTTRTTRVMNTLQSNPVLKLLGLNIATMVAPRTTIAFNRNQYAGQETALYESAGLFTNFALPGLVALGTAYALGKVNNPLGIRTTGWAKSAYIDSFAEIYKNSVDTVYQQALRPDMRPETLTRFIRSVLENLEVSDQSQSKPIKLNEKQLAQFTADIQRLMNLPKSDAKTTTQSIAKNLAGTLGSYDRLILKGKADTITQSDTLIQHLRYLGKEFQKSHTSDVPAQITENIGKMVKKLHQTTLAKSCVSLTVWLGLALSLQFINRWITKRRTGQSGFVGYSDFSQQTKSDGSKTLPKSLPITRTPVLPGQSGFVGYSDFNRQAKPDGRKALLQSLSTTQSPVLQPATNYPVYPTFMPMTPRYAPQPYVQPTAVYLTSPITMPAMQNPLPQPVHFSGLIPNLQSSQFLPTVEQLKVVYPLGALAKLLASRDLSEFRETLVLSGFGTLNFLFIPNLVENLVAHGFKNKNIFSKIPDFGQKQPANFSEKLKQRFQRLNHSSVRSYQDIEAYSKKLGEQLADKSDEEIHRRLSAVLRRVGPEFKNMRGLSAEAKAQQIMAAVAKELNGIKNISSITGIVYACFMLGIGLNLLNVYITNKKRARQLAKQAAQSQPQRSGSLPSPFI